MNTRSTLFILHLSKCSYKVLYQQKGRVTQHLYIKKDRKELVKGNLI